MITAPIRFKKPAVYHQGDTTQAKGMNSLIHPERLEPGATQDTLNMFWDGGSLTTRPGMVGQLTSAHGAAVYLSRHRYMLTSGVARIPYSTGGKLYYFEEGATAGVEIKKPGAVSFSFTDSSAVRFATIGKWLYFLDSGDAAGSVWRVNLQSTTTAEQVRGLDASLIQPSVAAGYRSLHVMTAAIGTWYADSGSATDLATDPWHAAGTVNTAGAIGTRWGTITGTPKVFDNGAVSELPASVVDATGTHAAKWLRLDDSGDTICLQDGSANNYLTNEQITNGSWNTGATSGYERYCCHWRLALWAISVGTSAKQAYARVRFYSDTAATTLLGENVLTISCPTPESPQFMEWVLNRDDFALPVKSIQLIYTPDSTSTVGTTATYITGTSFKCLPADLSTSTSGAISAGTVASLQGKVSQGMVSYRFTAAQDWSLVDSIGVPLTSDANPTYGDQVAGMPLRIRLRDSTLSNTVIWTSPLITDYANISLSLEGVPTAVRSAVKVLDIVFEGDISLTGIPSGRVPSASRVFLTTGGVTDPGNLSLGLSYAYIWTQSIGNVPSATTYVEGSGSPFSGFVEATAASRRATLGLQGTSVALPTLDSATTYINIYRLGGATPDGDTRARLVASVPIGANLASPVGTTKDQVGNLWYWDSTTYTLYDNTPDESLTYSDVYQVSRDRVPVGATALAHWAGRLWLTVYDATRLVNTVYGSWVIDSLNDFPYMSEATDPDDPELSVKGTLLPLGGQGTGDRAVALATSNLDTSGGNVGGSLMVLRQSAPPSIISGSIINNFALHPSPSGKGGGCLAAQGVENVNGATIYVAHTGLVSSQGYNLGYLSEAMEKRFSQEAIGKARYSLSFLCWHSRRLWCIVPGSGGSDGEALVWDERVNAWGRVSGYQGLGFTSACSLSGGEDSGDFYLGGRDGQVYKLSGSVSAPAATTDKATPAGTSRAISWLTKSRRYGQQSAQTPIRVSLNRPNSLFIDVSSGLASSVSWSIVNELAQTASGTHAIPAGRIQRSDIREIADVRGMTHEVNLSGSATSTLTLHSVLLNTVDTGETR